MIGRVAPENSDCGVQPISRVKNKKKLEKERVEKQQADEY